MAMQINTNVLSLTAQRNVAANESRLATSIERLSTGLRINRAGDDAAGGGALHYAPGGLHLLGYGAGNGTAPLAEPFAAIDALAAGAVDLYALEDGELPEALRGLSTAELELYIEEKSLEREMLRERIAELGRQRRQYLAEETKAKGLDDSRAFDAAVRGAIRDRLAEQGYEVPER